jgi:hypothetical protein
MRSLLLPLAVCAAVASARQSTLGLDLDFCGLPLLDSSSWNPICSGDRSQIGLEVDTGNLPENIHRAANKPAEIIDSASTSSANSQWSHNPKCMREHNSTETFCIYTNSKFAQNRGISIFTTPEHADRFLQLPAFVTPDVTEEANNEPNPPYEARELPGRGVGLIVNRTLHRGDHIFSNTPALVIHESVFEIFFKGDRQPFQTRGVHQLPEKTNKLFLDLCGHFGGDKVEDIINTNSFAVDMFVDNDDTAYNAVFPEISVRLASKTLPIFPDSCLITMSFLANEPRLPTKCTLLLRPQDDDPTRPRPPHYITWRRARNILHRPCATTARPYECTTSLLGFRLQLFALHTAEND